MITPLRIFVSDMDDDIRQQIIKDFEHWEDKGSIGNCDLRTQTEIFKQQDQSYWGYSDLLLMNSLAFEVYRYYVDLYLEGHHD